MLKTLPANFSATELFHSQIPAPHPPAYIMGKMKWLVLAAHSIGSTDQSNDMPSGYQAMQTDDLLTFTNLIVISLCFV